MAVMRHLPVQENPRKKGDILGSAPTAPRRAAGSDSLPPLKGRALFVSPFSGGRLFLHGCGVLLVVGPARKTAHDTHAPKCSMPFEVGGGGR